MAANLPIKFRERQHKWLNEAIEVESSSNKQRTSKKDSSSRLAANASSISIPSSSYAPKAQDMENIPFHGLGETVTIFGDDSTPSAHTPLVAPTDVSRWEEMDVFLEYFPTYTNIEPPTSHINELFLIMERVPVDVITDPQQNFMTRVPYGTSNKTIKAIMRLKDYLAMQTAEVVWYFLHIMHVISISFFLTFSPWFFMIDCS